MLNTRLLLGMAASILLATSACTSNTSLGQTTPCKPSATQVDRGCNEDPNLPAVAGSCEADGTCTCYAGFELSQTTKRCKLVTSGDAAALVCTVGADQTCNDDGTYSGVAGVCEGGVACACKTGFVLNLATGRCRAAPSGDAGADGPAVAVCTFLVDQTCNDDDTYSGVAGVCTKSGTCSCNAGFATNPATGRCRATTTADAAPTTTVCTPGMDQTCNDSLIMSALAGICQSDGTCVCRSGYTINPSTRRCGTPTVVPDASPGPDAGADVGDALVAKDTAAVCTPGRDQTCNDSPAISSLWGRCQNDGTCVCNSGYVINPATGRCASVAVPDAGPDAPTPKDVGSDVQPVCTVGMDQTCNDSPIISYIVGSCQPNGTCTCDSGFVINPASGRCMAPCTVGKDQTCNDDPSISALWGTCQGHGTCTCNSGFVINPATGRCARPSALCSGSYLACGCGCCGGTSPALACYYPSAGDTLDAIIATDRAAASSSNCAFVGCSLGQSYLCCAEAPPETASTATYSAIYVTGTSDRIGLSKVGTDDVCVYLALYAGSNSLSRFRVSTPATWGLGSDTIAGSCISAAPGAPVIGAQGTISFSPSGTTGCAVSAHVTVFLADSADGPVTAMRFDTDALPIDNGPADLCR